MLLYVLLPFWQYYTIIDFNEIYLPEKVMIHRGENHF